MAIKNKEGKWICSFCKKEYDRPIQADNCRDSHDLVYVVMEREDLNRLINYLYIGDPKLLRESITRTLQTALANSRNTVDKTGE